MERKPASRLAVRREAFRLWFEYLRLARSSDKQAIKTALIASQSFYAPWEMEKGEDFRLWWKSHAPLFEEKYIVRELKAGEPPVDPSALIVEIPLTFSPTALTKKVKALILAAFERRQQQPRKRRKKLTATYRLSEGAEPKLYSVRQMLTVYRDVYLKNQTLRGAALIEATHKHYLGRKRKDWAKVPPALNYGDGLDKLRAMRNLRRYIQKAEAVMLNVAKGQFPGPH